MTPDLTPAIAALSTAADEGEVDELTTALEELMHDPALQVLEVPALLHAPWSNFSVMAT